MFAIPLYVEEAKSGRGKDKLTEEFIIKSFENISLVITNFISPEALDINKSII